MGTTDAQERVALESLFQGPSWAASMFIDDFETFDEEEEARVITQNQTTRAYMSAAWSNPVSRKSRILRGKSLLIMVKPGLQLYAMGSFELEGYSIPPRICRALRLVKTSLCWSDLRFWCGP